MPLLHFSKFALLLTFLTSGCVAADVLGDTRDAASKTPYVSQLNEPQSNAYFHFARARMLMAENDREGAIAAYRDAIDYDPDDQGLRFELAELYMAVEQPKAAIRVLEDVLLHNPESLKANLTLGNAYFGNQQPGKAIPYFRRALELAPEKEQVRLHLAIALVRVGDVDLASEELKELLKLYPESRSGRMAMARLYRETGLNQLAVEQYRDLILRNPNLDQAYLELGLLYEELKEWQNALDVFRDVLEQRPLDFTLRHHLARVYVGMERYDDALEELNIIVELKPEDFDARRKIGLIYLEQKRWADAVSAFKELLDLKPDLDPSRYYLGTAYESLLKWDLALDAFLGIDRESALYDDAISHVGYIYLETGRVSEAIELLHSRMTEGKPRPQVYNYLTSLYTADGQHENALNTIENGVELYPDNVELLYQRVLILEQAGQHEDAMQAARELLAVDDEHAETLNFLAYALAVDNRELDQALAYAERAIKIKPAPHILDTLGWVYYRLGRLIEALKVIEEASLELAEDAVIFEHLGEIHLALKNLDQARTAFERALQLQPDNLDLRGKLETLADTQ
ncbi:MAG: tetratricopeptide repeat protein [Desulfuromonadales bacterium]|nr:tetratricopeptide repeat protein [Desulfuromonadales bacterium]